MSRFPVLHDDSGSAFDSRSYVTFGKAFEHLRPPSVVMRHVVQSKDICTHL